MVTKAASIETALGYMPISFREVNIGMKTISQALIDVGKSVPVAKNIDVRDVFPSATCFQNAICCIAFAIRTEFKNKILENAPGGGETSDGLNGKMLGRKFYDLVLH